MQRKADLIFVSVAAYRDPQLTPTIADCLAKASHSERLRFGICRQTGPEDEAFPFQADPRFRLLEIPWQQSRGACWARAEIMKMWDGEEWFLQVDSHCRFAQDWDRILIEAMAEVGGERTILSTYATPFTPGGEELLRDTPMLMAFEGFSRDGIPQLRPAEMPIRPNPLSPMRARFLSAGFLFAPGRFVVEAPYDPELYFLGEESAMTVRAFTHGYDLFHPGQTVVWHDYIRAESRKHWKDHTDVNVVRQTWADLDGKSKRKVERLLLGEPVESFGLGSARTIADYEEYAGLSFRMRKAQPYTLRCEEPPNPEAPPDWPGQRYMWITRIAIPRAALPEGCLDDTATWYVLIFDSDGTSLDRRQLSSAELSVFAGSEEEIALICEFSAETVPASWKIQPMNLPRGILRALYGRFQEGDYAILKEEAE